MLLVIKGFLSFKSRCCAALASKFLGNIILEHRAEDLNILEIHNDGRKEFAVNLPQTSILPTRNLPTILAAPAQKMTHVCGEYRELLRVLSKDWNSTDIRLCQTCRAWRPLGDQYWAEKSREEPLSSGRITSWTIGGGGQCPQCKEDYGFLGGDIDGVSSLTRDTQ